MYKIIKDECKEITDKIDFSQLNGKKVLVTGASGLVGIYMVTCLKEISDIDVTCWVKSDLEYPFNEIFDGCTIIKSDITDLKSFNNLPNYDCIIHAAGYGQPGKFLDNKIKTISLNTTSTIRLFEKLNKGGKFLFVSTSELYNGLDIEDIDEKQIGTTNTDHPRACYIEGKRCGETICHSYVNQGVDVKVVRLSLAYGPGTKRGDHRVLNSLIEKGLKNNKIELLDRGEAIRTYCYITDVVEMFWNVLFFGKNVVYNVGGDSVITIYDLAKSIGNMLNKEVSIPNNIKEMEGNPKVVNISTKNYKNEFGVIKFKPLDEGLVNTIKWQKELYERSYV